MIFKVTESVLETIGTLLGTTRSLIAIAEKDDTAASSLLKNVESFSEKLGSSMAAVGDNITISKKNIGLQVAKVAIKDVEIFSNFDSSNQISVGIIEDNLPQTSTFLASIFVPSSTFGSSSVIFYSRAYLQSTLFIEKDQVQAAQDGTNIVDPVQSIVLSVSLSNQKSSLQHPIIIKFQKKYFAERDSTCNFWEFGGILLSISLQLLYRYYNSHFVSFATSFFSTSTSNSHTPSSSLIIVLIHTFEHFIAFTPIINNIINILKSTFTYILLVSRVQLNMFRCCPFIVGASVTVSVVGVVALAFATAIAIYCSLFAV